VAARIGEDLASKIDQKFRGLERKNMYKPFLPQKLVFAFYLKRTATLVPEAYLKSVQLDNSY
jgi:hypothetical protein